jgi:hypothetical protein
MGKPGDRCVTAEESVMAMSGFAARSIRMDRASITSDLAELVHAFGRDLFGGYRPERHYMRGPGPKWHAKHDRAETAEPATDSVAAH